MKLTELYKHVVFSDYVINSATGALVQLLHCLQLHNVVREPTSWFLWLCCKQCIQGVICYGLGKHKKRGALVY